MLDPEDYSALLRLRCDVAFIRLQVKLLRLQLALRYDENQPRAPAGTPIGGQWIDGGGSGSGAARARIGQARSPTQADTTQDALHAEGWRALGRDYRPDGSLARELVAGPDGSRIYSEYAPAGGDSAWNTRHLIEGADGNILIVENAGDTQTMFDGRGQAISQSVWGQHGLETVPLVQPAFLPFLAVPAVTATVELAFTLFAARAALNALNGGDQPVIAFNAREYSGAQGKGLELSYVGEQTFEKVRDQCRGMKKVQGQTNSATIDAGDKNKYSSPATYGTAVHTILKNKISKDRSGRYLAEKSLLKSNQEGEGVYGRLGTIRIDVLEDAGNGDVCVYDIKTGKSRLIPGRMKEIAENVHKFKKDANRIFVIEIRPTE